MLPIYLAATLGVGEVGADNGIYIEPPGDEHSDELRVGRELWLDNCENCHGHGVADAPVPMRPDDWRSRVAKQRSVLYRHAIDGFIGPDYSMMPARGGNDDLSDTEVVAAVDYMVFLARHYIRLDESFIQTEEVKP